MKLSVYNDSELTVFQTIPLTFSLKQKIYHNIKSTSIIIV